VAIWLCRFESDLRQLFGIFIRATKPIVVAFLAKNRYDLNITLRAVW
jgi:hypothetical protein